jgi:hypothetical protein
MDVYTSPKILSALKSKSPPPSLPPCPRSTAVAAHAPLPPGHRARRQHPLPLPPPSPPPGMMGVRMSNAGILVLGEAGALPTLCRHWSRRSAPCSLSPTTSKRNPRASPTSVSLALLQHHFLSRTCRSKRRVIQTSNSCSKYANLLFPSLLFSSFLEPFWLNFQSVI